MRVSFNQPAFIPWGGFFARLLNSDEMIILDDTQFARGFTYVNRNRLKGPQGEIWITVPIKKKGLGPQQISQLKIHQPEKWQKNFLALIKHYYGHSLHYEELYEKLLLILENSRDDFLAMAVSTTKLLQELFDLKTPMLLQSEIGIKEKGLKLLINLARKIGAKELLLPYLAGHHLNLQEISRAGFKIYLLKYNQYPYPQFWGEFIANLSAVDIFLCCGPNGQKIIKKSTKIIPWR